MFRSTIPIGDVLVRRLLPLLALGLAGCPAATGTLPTEENLPPDEPTLGISPVSPTTIDDLSLTILQDATDPEGGPVTYRHEWFVDNEPLLDPSEPDTVSSDVTTKGEVWRVFTRAVDQEGLEGAPVSSEVTIANSPPAATASIQPSEPSSLDDLQLVVVVEDLDGDASTTAVHWLLDDNPVPAFDGFATIAAAETTRGQIWSVEVTPNDGEADGDQATATVLVRNDRPTVSGVVLSPEDPREADTLNVTTAAPEDGDGDPVSLAYQWYVGGDLVLGAEVDTLSSDHFDKADEVFVLVTPFDDSDLGDPVQSNQVVVDNTPPSGQAVGVSPSEGTEATVFSCEPSGWLDPDPADSEGYVFQWFVGGSPVASTASVDGSVFNRDDVLHCEATPTDGEAEGEILTSSTVTVSNTPPTLTSATLSPAAAVETDVLLVAAVGFADADGDPPGYTYAWYVGGAPVATSGPSLGGDWFSKGDDVYVEVTPFDGTTGGAHVTTNTVTVLNSPPSLVSVSLTPSVVFTTSNVSATPNGWSDIDGDSPGYTYAWFVAGAPVGFDNDTLSSTFFSRGQQISVEVTPQDGEDVGAPVASSPITVANSPPDPPVVEISPAEPEDEDELTCIEITPSTDADADSVETAFLWLQGGVPTAFSGAQLPASATGDGEEWTCVATPNDSLEDGAPGLATVVIGCPYLFQDDDGDGQGDPEVSMIDCDPVPGWVGNSDDCDDDDDTTYLGAAELCDGADNDCDGSPGADEIDGDGDGVAECEGDCDDGDDTTFEGAAEICGDGVDQDCDGVDEPCSGCGDGILDPGEEVDPPVSIFTTLTVDPVTCRYDFSNVPQLYCNGGCTWDDSQAGCGEGDADIFCQLKTDNPLSESQAFGTVSALPTHGFPCARSNYGTPMGADVTDRLMSPLSFAVRYMDGDVRAAHNNGGTVINVVVCTDP